MATQTPPSNERTEDCERCDRETPHAVSVELRTESSKLENSQFSREPYRISECHVCGTTTARRMNDA